MIKNKNIILLFLLAFGNFGFCQTTGNDTVNVQDIAIKTKHGILAFTKRCSENYSFYQEKKSELVILEDELSDEAESKHIKKDEVIIVFNIDSNGLIKNFRVGKKGKLQNLKLLAEKFCQELEIESQKNKYKVVRN